MDERAVGGYGEIFVPAEKVEEKKEEQKEVEIPEFLLYYKPRKKYVKKKRKNKSSENLKFLINVIASFSPIIVAMIMIFSQYTR